MPAASDASGDPFLMVAEIGQLLKLNPQIVRSWIDAGTLPAMAVGSRVRVRRVDFDRLLAQGLPSPPADPPTRITVQDFLGWDGPGTGAPSTGVSREPIAGSRDHALPDLRNLQRSAASLQA
jgi:excisionase family DNA binding protein